jgi:hypothetical protein
MTSPNGFTISRQFDSATDDRHQRNLLALHEEEPTPPDDAGRRNNVSRQKHLDAYKGQRYRHAQGSPDIESILQPKGSSQEERYGQRLPRHDRTQCGPCLPGEHPDVADREAVSGAIGVGRMREVDENWFSH